MAQPYIGEIRIFAGNFAPSGWLFCEGQLLPIADNDALFQLIGTTYGGDGESTFALPDLRGRLPMHQGGGFVLAETGGAEEVTVTVQQVPVHTHRLVGAGVAGNQTSAVGAVPANSLNVTPYRNTTPDTPMHPQSVAPVGGSQPHENRQPFLCVSFIISLFGIFPSPT